jgi:hypothetical protein
MKIEMVPNISIKFLSIELIKIELSVLALIHVYGGR